MFFGSNSNDRRAVASLRGHSGGEDVPRGEEVGRRRWSQRPSLATVAPVILGDNLGATYFFALADPFPRVLRVLSADYLALAHGRLARALAQAGQRHDDWRLGWVHPGYGLVPDFDREREVSPLTFVGWISRDAYDAPGSAQDHVYEALGRELRAGEPALCWGATSSRAYWFDVAPDDRTATLIALIEIATSEPGDWTYEVLAACAPDPDEPLLACARAVRDHDLNEYHAARAAANAVYSPAGLVLLRAGLSTVMVDPPRCDIASGTVGA